MNKIILNKIFMSFNSEVFFNKSNCIGSANYYTHRYFSTDSAKDITKESYILELWITDFPAYSELSYDQLLKLSSQSGKISNWFTEANEKYQNWIDAPKWMADTEEISDDWSKEKRDKLIEARKLASTLAQHKNKIALEAKKKLLDANDEYKTNLISLFKKDPFLLIEFFNTSMLPIDVLIQSYQFETADESKKFLSDSLLNYKKKIYSDYKAGNLTISDLLQIIDTK